MEVLFEMGKKKRGKFSIKNINKRNAETPPQRKAKPHAKLNSRKFNDKKKKTEIMRSVSLSSLWTDSICNPLSLSGQTNVLDGLDLKRVSLIIFFYKHPFKSGRLGCTKWIKMVQRKWTESHPENKAGKKKGMMIDESRDQRDEGMLLSTSCKTGVK